MLSLKLSGCVYVMGVHAKNSLNRLVNRCHIHSLFEITNKEMIAASTFIFSMKCMIELKRAIFLGWKVMWMYIF